MSVQEKDIEDPRGFVPESQYLRKMARSACQYAKRYERLASLAEEFEREDAGEARTDED